MNECPLCAIENNVVFRAEEWTCVLNDDQRALGRCYFALGRHETDVLNLTGRERDGLWDAMARAKAGMDRLFRPDHYNYVFLMNATAHVHAHMIPRYKSSRAFAGGDYDDGRYGDHYDIVESRYLPPDTRARLLDALREETRR